LVKKHNTENSCKFSILKSIKGKKMDITTITERIQKLSLARKNRPSISIIRDIFDGIEIALNKKVKQEAIWEILKNEGYLSLDDGKIIPLKTFLSAITRIKNDRCKIQNNFVGNPAIVVPKFVSKKSITNPFLTLSGNTKHGDFNPIPKAKIEIDNS
jgi:hypothetical protein